MPDHFNRRKNTTLWWYNKSSDLYASARVLWIAMDAQKDSVLHKELGFGSGFAFDTACWPVYQMIFGMAFELMLKAIIVSTDDEPPHIHDLVKLSHFAEIELSLEEEKVFAILSQHILWDGRYPVPKNQGQLQIHYANCLNLLDKTEDLDVPQSSALNNPLDWDYLNAIWMRLSQKL